MPEEFGLAGVTETGKPATSSPSGVAVGAEGAVLPMMAARQAMRDSTVPWYVLVPNVRPEPNVRSAAFVVAPSGVTATRAGPEIGVPETSRFAQPTITGFAAAPSGRTVVSETSR